MDRTMNPIKKVINIIRTAKLMSEILDFEKTVEGNLLKMRIERIKMLQPTQRGKSDRESALNIVERSNLSSEAKNKLLKIIQEL